METSYFKIWMKLKSKWLLDRRFDCVQVSLPGLDIMPAGVYDNTTELLMRGNTGVPGRWMFRVDICRKLMLMSA